MAHSTVAIGTAFEHHAVRFLRADMRMAVRRVGRRGDGGIDIRGYWWLPKGKSRPSTSAIEPTVKEARTPRFHPPPGLVRSGLPSSTIAAFRVIAQCKAERRRVGPARVREFEGTVASLENVQTNGGGTKPKHPPLIGVMLSQKGFTTDATMHASRSAVPLLLVHLPGGHPDDLVAADVEGGVGLDGWDAEGASPSTPASTPPLSPPSSSSSSSSSSSPSPSTESDSESDTPSPKKRSRKADPGKDYGPPPRTDVLGLWWNKAFTNTIPGVVELRCEMSPNPGPPVDDDGAPMPMVSRVGMWYFGGRMGRYGPPA